MTKKKFKEKYNDGCIKVFKLLLLLYNNEAAYDDVIEIFNKNNPYEKHNVTLNKFLNTLKVFGVKVEKRNNKYKMRNIPFAAKFDSDDLRAIAIFEKALNELPDKSSKEELSACIEHIKLHFNDKTSYEYNQILENDNNDYSFYYKELKEQIAICEDFTSKNFKINIKYYDKNDGIAECHCTPKEVTYNNKNAYLVIYKTNTKILEEIPINKIISIQQMPTQKDSHITSTTVAFRLKGRLAKAYTLKDGEYISEYGEDGSILVINRNEPTERLLSRLMKYDYNCIIEYPKDLKRKMQEKINDTLKNYE